MNTIIIAEAGVNHNGNMETAKKLIKVAADAGVDYVKFQTFKANALVCKDAKKAKYQIKNNQQQEESQYEMLEKLELSYNDHLELINHCSKHNIKFLSTAFDLESIEELNRLNIDFYKIPSGEITNKPYLRSIAKKNKKVVLSTGMAEIKEIDDALNVLIKTGLPKNDITVLHCNTEYPTPFEDVNLLAMLHIKNEFKVDVGYSDHTLGIEVPIAAVSLGAKVIEKHFTLDRSLPGPDHAASLEPDELKKMVTSIRNIEKAISGSGQKEPSISELKNKSIVRKSIVAASTIKRGELLSNDNLTVKRPGNGINPMEWDSIVGTVAIRDFQADECIETNK